MEVRVPVRFRRLIAAIIPMLSLWQISATTRPRRGAARDVWSARDWPSISRNGDGMNVERRPVKRGAMPFYTVGRSYLLELYHSELQAYQGQNCRWTNDPDALMSRDGA